MVPCLENRSAGSRKMVDNTLSEKNKLALHGGSSVREKLLRYGNQLIGRKDTQAVISVLQSDWLTMGLTVTDGDQSCSEEKSQDLW
jgi:hypothetical protein